MNAEKARAIIAQALEDEATEGPVPEDDKKAIEKAEELVALAREAFEKNVRGREVENIIALADSDIGENGSGPKAESANKEQEMDEPFEGYDTLKVSEIKEAIEGLLETDEMEDEDKIAVLVETFDYEAVNGTRASILNVIDKAHEQLTGKPYAAPKDTGDDDPAPEPTPEPEGDAGDDGDGVDPALAQNEPWEGYDEMSVKEITDGLDLIVEDEDYSDDERRDILMHVYVYESANRESKRIINKVEKLGQEKGFIGGENESANPPSSEGDGEDAAAPEDDEGAEASAEDGEGGGASDEDGDDAAADAAAEQRAEAPEEGDEDRDGADEAPARSQARRQRAADDDDEWELNYKELIESVKARIDSERLHVPAKITEDAPELPIDLTVLSDSQVQQLHSAFTSYAYRIGYLRMLEDGYAKASKQAADEMTDRLLANYEPDKGETVTSIKAKVDQDENVKRLRRAQHKHETFASSYKMQQENYNGLLDRLSRFWTMRHEEWERSGSKVGRKAPGK